MIKKAKKLPSKEDVNDFDNLTGTEYSSVSENYAEDSIEESIEGSIESDEKDYKYNKKGKKKKMGKAKRQNSMESGQPMRQHKKDCTAWGCKCKLKPEKRAQELQQKKKEFNDNLQQKNKYHHP